MKFVVFLFLILVAANVTADTTLRWWQFWTDPAIKPTIETIVDEFEQANPGINVELTDLTWANGHEKIVLSLASGTGPDVLELGSDWIAQFAANGHLADISSMIADDSSAFQGWSMADYDDKIYAFPWILGTRVLFANRELLTRAGYDPDFVPVTWDDLKQSAAAVSALGSGVYGWGSNAAEKHRLYKKFLPFFWSAQGQIFSDNGQHCVLASTYAIDALQTYKDLHDSSGYVANQRGIEDAFLEGKVGFVLSGDWLLKRIELEKHKIDLVSTLMPGPTFIGRSFMGGEFLAVTEASEQKEAAMKLIRFVTSPKNQVRFCKANRSANPSSIVAQTDEYFSSNIHLQTFIKQIPMSNHPPVDPDWVFIENIIEEAIEESLFESGGVAEPLRKARGKIAKLKSQ
ncbi:MAG: extracellular solute-binding protein [candidate division Zixibacteria bacterium]|nr:extracellular solute-binding protein [candidate division Zixibacteria bacterium]